MTVELAAGRYGKTALCGDLDRGCGLAPGPDDRLVVPKIPLPVRAESVVPRGSSASDTRRHRDPRLCREHHSSALDQPLQAGDVWRDPAGDTAETGVQAVIVRVLPANCVAYCRSGTEAGPRTTRPLVSNVEPWHGHTKVWLAKPVIVHVWCVQVAPRAMKDS